MREALRKAVDDCYDAVLAPETFGQALHRLARSLDAACMMFYARDARDQFLRLPASHDFVDFLGEFVRDGWWSRDHRADRGFPRFEREQRLVLIEHDVANDEDRRRLPQYHDLYPKYDLPWWAGASFRVEGRLWVVPFLRSSSQGPFDRADARRLRSLAPHFERMVAFSARITNAQGTAALNILEAASKPALLLDWQGKAVAMNPAAQRLIGGELRLSAGRLWTSDPQSNGQLQTLIAKAGGARAPSSLDADMPAVIRRPYKRPLLVDAIPTSGVLRDAFLHARAILMLTDLDGRAPGSEALLRKLFGLTPHEARIAHRMGAGLTPREVAAETGTTLGTIRSILHQVYGKLDVKGQSGLIRIVERLGRHRTTDDPA
ncbi:MAG: helix-turn-helix transcriptional regulator [Bauldia sp.]